MKLDTLIKVAYLQRLTTKEALPYAGLGIAGLGTILAGKENWQRAIGAGLYAGGILGNLRKSYLKDPDREKNKKKYIISGALMGLQGPLLAMHLKGKGNVVQQFKRDWNIGKFKKIKK